ncbi:MAG: DsrE family protein [Rhodocyclaceae bacterium]|nr:DsrE family protein [Rhodocyclaceae bacterium]
MKTPLRFLALLAAACLVHLPAVHAAEPAAAVQKTRLVLQVSDDDAKKWNLALSNAHNVQADLGKANVDIEIVAFGPGIGMLKEDTPVANRVEDAMADGVHFVACGNTMAAQKLTPDDMVKGLEYAKAGIVRLMQRQQQGWIYIRP